MNTRILALLVLTTASLFFTSCYKTDYFPCIKARGSSVEENRTSGEFDAIDLRLHAKVFVKKGPEAEVLLSAPLNVLDYIQTNISGSTLTIDNARCINNRADEIVLYITVPQLSSLRIAGSGYILVEDYFVSEMMNADIAGSGKITMEGDFDSFHCSISGSGDIIVGGTARNQYARISGSGAINTLDMESERVDVKISGSGSAKVFATQELVARITGSGSIYYRGNPDVNVSITGTGKLIQL